VCYWRTRAECIAGAVYDKCSLFANVHRWQIEEVEISVLQQQLALIVSSLLTTGPSIDVIRRAYVMWVKWPWTNQLHMTESSKIGAIYHHHHHHHQLPTCEALDTINRHVPICLFHCYAALRVGRGPSHEMQFVLPDRFWISVSGILHESTPPPLQVVILYTTIVLQYTFLYNGVKNTYVNANEVSMLILDRQAFDSSARYVDNINSGRDEAHDHNLC